MGIYYATPLLGPSLGPLIGGTATKLFSWRATFYFLAIFGGVCLLSFVFFKDTFRKERSLSYQTALRQLLRERGAAKANGSDELGATESEPPKAVQKEGVPISAVEVQVEPELKEIRLTLRHLDMIRPIILVLRRINNICILTASGTFNISRTVYLNSL